MYYAQLKKPDSKSCDYMIAFTWHIAKPNYWKKNNQWLQGRFGVMGLLYFDGSGGYTPPCLCRNSQNHTLRKVTFTIVKQFFCKSSKNKTTFAGGTTPKPPYYTLS